MLSHGHYDHTGGVKFLSEHLNDKAKVYLHPLALEKKYANIPDGYKYNEISEENKRSLENLGKNMKYLGRMNDPTASAFVKGICGDEMEFYLYIKNDIIEEVKFYTENGCNNTKNAGNEVAKLAEKANIFDALKINPRQVMDNLGLSVKDEGKHCAILAVITLYKAVADYLLKD